MEYIHDEKNKLSYYNDDIELIINNRINNINRSTKNIKQINLKNIDNNGFNSIFNNKNKNMKNNYFYTKINQKILKTKNETHLNNQTERQKPKNFLFNYPTKSYTIDHMSKSNSRKKQNFKSPNLTRFNTRKYLKSNQNKIRNNTIENQIPINIIYKNKAIPKYEIEKKYTYYSKLSNKRRMNFYYDNTSGNKNNFRILLYNKSLDNKYSKEKNNCFINYNLGRLNNIKDIRKKIYGTIDNKRRMDSHNSYSPIMTGVSNFNEQKHQENSFFVNTYNNYRDKSKNKKNKSISTQITRKKVEEKNDKINYNINKINNNNYYAKNKSNNIKKNFLNSFGLNNYKTKNKNKILFSLSQQKDKKENNKKIKTKKASSFSIDLNIKIHPKNEYNIYTNRPKRKNVMKFVNKNNMNLRIGNLYSKYDYGYRKENKNNKSLDL